MKKIVIDIERVLAEKGVSKTTLCYWCRLQRTQLNNYCKNKVVRVDLHTLEKVCDILKMVEAEGEEAKREKMDGSIL